MYGKAEIYTMIVTFHHLLGKTMTIKDGGAPPKSCKIGDSVWAQLVSFDDEGALLELLKLFAEGFDNSICWKSERAGNKKMQTT